MIEWIQWCGSVSGIAGALLLALRLPISGWGYVLFLISSLTLGIWACWFGASELLTQQLVFTVINLIGVWCWLWSAAPVPIRGTPPGYADRIRPLIPK